jgi:putative ABC transport system permease protein
MTSEITMLVIIAYLVSAPLAYLWIKHWLVQFAYKTPINEMIFIFALALSLMIAWFTVSAIAIKTARKNPIISLRYE